MPGSNQETTYDCSVPAIAGAGSFVKGVALAKFDEFIADCIFIVV